MAIVEAMVRLGDNAAVQENGSVALTNISAGSYAHKDALVSVGGIDAIVAAMKRHGDNAKIQEKCCGALWNMCGSKAHRDALLLAGFKDAVAAAIRRHGNNVVADLPSNMYSL